MTVYGTSFRRPPLFTSAFIIYLLHLLVFGLDRIPINPLMFFEGLCAIQPRPVDQPRSHHLHGTVIRGLKCCVRARSDKSLPPQQLFTPLAALGTPESLRCAALHTARWRRASKCCTHTCVLLGITAWHGTARGAVQCGAVQCGAVRCGACMHAQAPAFLCICTHACGKVRPQFLRDLDHNDHGRSGIHH